MLLNILVPNKVRRFTHVSGYTDETDYIECHPDGKTYLIEKDGTVVNHGYLTFEKCLNEVELGRWKEITNNEKA